MKQTLLPKLRDSKCIFHNLSPEIAEIRPCFYTLPKLTTVLRYVTILSIEDDNGFDTFDSFSFFVDEHLSSWSAWSCARIKNLRPPVLDRNTEIFLSRNGYVQVTCSREKHCGFFAMAMYITSRFLSRRLSSVLSAFSG